MTAPASTARPAAPAEPRRAGRRCRGGGTRRVLSLQTPGGIGLSVQWRYVGKVMAETLVDNQSLKGDFNFDPGLHVPAQNYFDLAATFAVGDAFNFRLGVNNVFDKQPPFVTSGSGSRSGLQPLPDRSVQRQHLSRHLGCAGSLYVCRRNAQLLTFRASSPNPESGCLLSISVCASFMSESRLSFRSSRGWHF